MRHYNLYTTLLLLALSMLSATAGAIAQEPVNPLQGIRATSQSVAHRAGDKVIVDFELDLSEMDRLSSNTVLQVTPILQAHDGSEQMELHPITVSGRTRAIVLKRAGDKADIIRNKRKEQSYHYTTEIPFALWMKEASLTLYAKSYGCAGCELGDYQTIITGSALAPLYKPTYRFAMLTPEGEETKRREESLTAQINFLVSKTDLRPDLGNNRSELNRIEAKLKELTSNKDLSVDALSLTGYASPEGTAELNDRLAKGRVESIASYLVGKYPPFKGHYSSQAMGADWAGLQAAVEESTLEHKDRIVEIIQTIPPSERTAALRAIDKGQTYATLLQTIYPPLRRTVITFSFVVKGFDLTEAREVIKSHPTYLSLAEINLVANSYPAGSKEQYDTWVIAAKAFPKAVEPATNAAILDIKAGRYAQAVQLLEQYKDNPQLATILGIAHAYNGDHEQAHRYLTQAAALGLPDAQYNLDECTHYIEDNF